MTTAMLRIRQVVAATGLSRSSVYAYVRDGTLPPAVKIGPRCSAWPAHEIERVIAARIAGKSESEVRAIVAEMIAARRKP